MWARAFSPPLVHAFLSMGLGCEPMTHCGTRGVRMAPPPPPFLWTSQQPPVLYRVSKGHPDKLDGGINVALGVVVAFVTFPDSHGLTPPSAKRFPSCRMALVQRATLTPGRDPHAMLEDMVIAVNLKDPTRHQSLHLVHVRHILTKVHFQMGMSLSLPYPALWTAGGSLGGGIYGKLQPAPHPTGNSDDPAGSQTRGRYWSAVEPTALTSTSTGIASV